eukprot:381597-Pelagomonas_calceolata.AAC.2
MHGPSLNIIHPLSDWPRGLQGVYKKEAIIQNARLLGCVAGQTLLLLSAQDVVMLSLQCSSAHALEKREVYASQKAACINGRFPNDSPCILQVAAAAVPPMCNCLALSRVQLALHRNCPCPIRRLVSTVHDALTKTIPIWAAVINRAIARVRSNVATPGSGVHKPGGPLFKAAY